GDTVLNLKSAVHGETYEYTDMYPGMAKTAREEGFAESADGFETLAKAEKSHAGRFSNLLKSISCAGRARTWNRIRTSRIRPRTGSHTIRRKTNTGSRPRSIKRSGGRSRSAMAAGFAS